VEDALGEAPAGGGLADDVQVGAVGEGGGGTFAGGGEDDAGAEAGFVGGFGDDLGGAEVVEAHGGLVAIAGGVVFDEAGEGFVAAEGDGGFVEGGGVDLEEAVLGEGLDPVGGLGTLLDDVGLVDALRELLRELAERSETEATLDASGLADTLPPGVEITLYRVTQEAAGNALKHSGGDALRVTVRSDGADVTLQVADNGSGFDVAEVEAPRGGHHYGLVGMRERVELLDGESQIDSAPGSGTVVTVTIPLSGKTT